MKDNWQKQQKSLFIQCWKSNLFVYIFLTILTYYASWKNYWIELRASIVTQDQPSFHLFISFRKLKFINKVVKISYENIKHSRKTTESPNVYVHLGTSQSIVFYNDR